MNKNIIILLAICLVCVNAFVKRDTPEAPKTDFIADASKKIGEGLEELKKNFNTESIKKALDDSISSITKAFKDFKPAETPKAS